MSDHSIDVSDTELAILEILWERGQATIREIDAALYEPTTTATYASVQKLLERLEAKGCVARDRSGFAHVFRPVIAKTVLIDRRLQEVADKLCSGSLIPLITHLIENRKLTAKDRKALRKWLEGQTEGG